MNSKQAPPWEKHNNALVLVPTYNEREMLPHSLAALQKIPNIDVCVLDDNSPDGTGEIANTWAIKHKNFHVLHRPGKSGLGAAYIAGFKEALKRDYDYILQFDADLSHPPAAIPTMLELAKKHDLIIGSRWVRGGGTENWPLKRQLISKAGSLYARLWLGLPIMDLTGGYKCFRKKVLKNLNLDSLRSQGYVFQIEMNFRAYKQGFSLVETPILFTERAEGNSKMTGNIVWEAIRRVPQLRFSTLN
jgi:dolichol-phosphate mannosyltransferase